MEYRVYCGTEYSVASLAYRRPGHHFPSLSMHIPFAAVRPKHGSSRLHGADTGPQPAQARATMLVRYRSPFSRVQVHGRPPNKLQVPHLVGSTALQTQAREDTQKNNNNNVSLRNILRSGHGCRFVFSLQHSCLDESYRRHSWIVRCWSAGRVRITNLAPHKSKCRH